ncbi:MAG: hypothetical protein GX047_05555 [Firmicutes bacterium]|nr:hypothetical protein [Bacillota bacterium]NLY30080.1 hypothetical protein [Bacillota bacterium]
MNQRLDWDVNTIQEAVKREYRLLDGLDESGLTKLLLARIAEIAGVEPNSSASTVGKALVKRAAGLLRHARSP